MYDNTYSCSTHVAALYALTWSLVAVGNNCSGSPSKEVVYQYQFCCIAYFPMNP